jgi:hypothetical protein
MRHRHYVLEDKHDNPKKVKRWAISWEEQQHRACSQRSHRRQLPGNKPEHIRTLTAKGQCRAPGSKHSISARENGWGYGADPAKLALALSVKILAEAVPDKKYDLFVDGYWKPDIKDTRYLLDGGGDGGGAPWSAHRAPRGGDILDYASKRVIAGKSIYWFDTEFHAKCRCPTWDFRNPFFLNRAPDS